MTAALDRSSDPYTVIVRGERFLLTKEQILVDAPNFFTAMFNSSSAEPTVKIVSLPNMHPRLFAIIYEYLCGYKVTPIPQNMFPSTMDATLVIENLRKDAGYLQLKGLISLLGPPADVSPEQLLRELAIAEGAKRIMSLESLEKKELRKQHPSSKFIADTIIIARGLQFRVHSFLDEKGIEHHVPKYGLDEISVLRRYAQDYQVSALRFVSINGIEVPTLAWHDFSIWLAHFNEVSWVNIFDAFGSIWPPFAKSNLEPSHCRDSPIAIVRQCNLNIEEMVFKVVDDGQNKHRGITIYSLKLSTTNRGFKHADFGSIDRIQL